MTYVPFETWETGDESERPGRGTSNTKESWMLALLPLLAAVVVILVAIALRQLNIQTVIIVGVLLAPLGIPLAARDQRRLMARGYKQPTSRHLGLAPVAYLFMRGTRCVREQFEGLGPFWVNVAAGALVFASMTVLFPWILAAIYLGQRLSP